MAISFFLTLLASLAALISAWYWFSSSRIIYEPVEFDTNNNLAEGDPQSVATSTVFIQGAPAAATSHVDAAKAENSKKIAVQSQKLNAQISEFVTANSSLNAKASFWTACAVSMGAVAVVFNKFGY